MNIKKPLIAILILTLLFVAIVPAAPVYADDITWTNLGLDSLGANYFVRAVATAPNGDIYVGGLFTVIGSVPANHIARWDGTSSIV